MMIMLPDAKTHKQVPLSLQGARGGCVEIFMLRATFCCRLCFTLTWMNVQRCHSSKMPANAAAQCN